MKTCKGCKWADWIRTEKGRLHPCGQGFCTFPVKMPVLPQSVLHNWAGFDVVDRLERLTKERLRIWRNSELKDHCPCYAPDGT